MKDQSKKLVSQGYRRSRFRLLRTAWGGAIASVAAGGLLFTAADGAPALHVPDAGRGLAAPVHGPREAVPARQTETVPERVRLEQIEAVLERAERQAREQGPDLSPTTAQAAAELGMLYTTYQMQRAALDEKGDGPRTRDVRAAGPAVQVAYVPAAAGRTEAAEVIEPEVIEAEMARVTFGQLVIAAERLANLLDSALPDALVDVQHPDRRAELSPPRSRALAPDLPGARGHQGFSLRERLLDAVTMFEGSTLGYANGRIPADALCPLEFAPGHLLRCDAAERLTALSAEFEREFGYPIPLTDSYRPYVQQVVLASTKPHLAAVPGTSNHGWGLAVDLSDPIAGGGSPEYVWLRVHGPDYGWDNPSWARPGGTKPEPWHFEFFAAGAVPNRAIDPSDVGTHGPAEAADASDGAHLGHDQAADLDPKDDSPSGAAAKPAARPAKEPAKEPGADQPAQRPAKPGPKPDPRPDPKPTPTEPRPKPPATGPTPTPTPTPTPSPTPSKPGEEPAPTPSEPAPTPTPTPSDDGGTPAPAPAPSPSQPPSSPPPAPTPSPTASEADGPVSRLAEELGLSADED